MPRVAYVPQHPTLLLNCLRLEPETVVILVRANPKPGDHVAFANANRAIVVSDSHNAHPVPPFFEPERGMVRMLFPKRIFRERVFALWSAAHGSASRIAGAFGRSRQILKISGARVRADLIHNFAKSAAFSEIGINLSIPSGIVARANKCGELRQFYWG